VRPLLALRAILLAAAALWSLSGCGASSGSTSLASSARVVAGTVVSSPSATFPVTVTDDNGRQVTIRQQPRRIVSAAPSNTEILFALGLGDRVVGVTDFCDYPEEAKQKPKIGGLRPNLEAVVALQPDLVLGIRGTPPDLLAAMDALQVPVAILNPSDFPGVLANVRTVGRLTGATSAAEQVAATMAQRWDAVAAKAKTAATRPRVLYEIDATSPAAVSVAGAGTFIDAMITAAGGDNVAASLIPGQQYPKISAEAVLQAHPDVVILGDSAYGESRETLMLRPGWAALDAVRRGAVAGIPDSNLTSRAGPRLVDGLEVVARAIHPELFGDPSGTLGTSR
jgi:iron complex transport system substrate-binding protein